MTGPVSISVGSGSSIVNVVRPVAVVGVINVGGASVEVYVRFTRTESGVKSPSPPSLPTARTITE